MQGQRPLCPDVVAPVRTKADRSGSANFIFKHAHVSSLTPTKEETSQNTHPPTSSSRTHITKNLRFKERRDTHQHRIPYKERGGNTGTEEFDLTETETLPGLQEKVSVTTNCRHSYQK